MSVPDPIEVALLVTQILEDLGITYVLGGSLASTIHGEPRATLDVDLAVDLRPEHLEPLRQRLGDDFYADGRGLERAIEEHGSVNLIFLASSLKVDLFVPPPEGIHLKKWTRRQRVVLQRDPEQSIWVTDPEDIILQKLDWYRQGGGVSDSQWRDVLGVLKVQGDRLDGDYLQEWAARMNLEQLLDRALVEAGLEPE